MAYADWEINVVLGTLAEAGIAVAHAGLSSPLTGHGTNCRSAEYPSGDASWGVSGRCLRSICRNVPAEVSTFVSAYLRIEEASSAGYITGCGVFLAHDDLDPGNQPKGTAGYNVGLYNTNGVTTLRLYCDPPPSSGKAGVVDVVVATLAHSTWYRVKLERIYVDATHLRLVVSTADPLVDEDDWTVVYDDTVESADNNHYAGPQATMGFWVMNSYQAVNKGLIDGWKGGRVL